MSMMLAVDSINKDEIVADLSPFIRVYKSGRIERLLGNDIVPPSVDPVSGVQSKDVTIDANSGVSARLYIPKITNPDRKLTLLIYFHGGGFCIETPFSPTYHNYLNSVVAGANVIAVSVDYGRAPEHPVPIAHEDSWAAVKWVASHSDRNHGEEWLNHYADFGQVYLAGDSAGGNIAHNMALRIGEEKLNGISVSGISVSGIWLAHPFFWGNDRIGVESEYPDGVVVVEGLWRFVCPATCGCDDPLMNPANDRRLGRLGCERVLVFVAEKDLLKDRGWDYKEKLEKSGWNGVVNVVESNGEDHVFHLLKPHCQNSVDMMKAVVDFMSQVKA